MRKSTFKRSIVGLFTVAALSATAQDGDSKIQNYRAPGYDGLNVFETKKGGDTPFDGLKVRVGGDFALQFQGLSQENKWNSDSLSGAPELVDLAGNFNLPTANLNLDVQLADGLRMHLRTYLSARHHPEAWVKGGYIQMDNLNFIKDGFLSGLMDITTVKIGMDEINYGDAHFRRTDNASAVYNPFVGNYLMDAFTTEAFAEFNFQPKDFLIVAGISNGKLNQSPIKGAYTYTPSIYGKLGWDSQINEDTRLRFTGSFYTSGNYNRAYLYGGDRGGSRYYNVMHTKDGNSSSDFSGRVNPGFSKFTSFQFNPFVKWKGLEFFGIYEMASGDKSETVTGGGYSQIAAELIYRFGSWDQLYVGGRYNMVDGKDTENSDGYTVDRMNLGIGWFMTKNVIVKLEYVNQTYNGDDVVGTLYEEGQFNGVMFEAAISF